MNAQPQIHLASTIAEYQVLINRELEAIEQNNKKDASQLLEILDDFELNINIPPQGYSIEIAIFHLLAYFIVWDLENLRFLLKRTRPEIKNSPEIAVIVETFRAAWKRNYANVFSGVKKALAFFQRSPNFVILILLLQESVWENFKKHLNKNFSSISVEDLKKMTGLSEKEIQEFCSKNHWKTNKNGEIALSDEVENKKMVEVLDKQIGQLTEMVAYMEKLN